MKTIFIFGDFETIVVSLSFFCHLCPVTVKNVLWTFDVFCQMVRQRRIHWLHSFTFCHCGFSNVSSICLPVGMQRHIALCGYPLYKAALRKFSKMLSSAPIFLTSHYFRQNIWRLSSLQFHFLYIFGNELNTVN